MYLKEAIATNAGRYGVNPADIEFDSPNTNVLESVPTVDITFPDVYSASVFVNTFELAESSWYDNGTHFGVGKFSRPVRVSFPLSAWPDKFNPEKRLP